jgi:hypothetical protein
MKVLARGLGQPSCFAAVPSEEPARGSSRSHVACSIGLGAVLEVAAFLSLTPKDSMQPSTPLQNAEGYTQVPFGHACFFVLNHLPLVLAIVGLAVLFLLQSAVMGIPVWLAIKLWVRIVARR